LAQHEWGTAEAESMANRILELAHQDSRVNAIEHAFALLRYRGLKTSQAEGLLVALRGKIPSGSTELLARADQIAAMLALRRQTAFSNREVAASLGLRWPSLEAQAT
jgi:hypothetical protein